MLIMLITFKKIYLVLTMKKSVSLEKLSQSWSESPICA